MIDWQLQAWASGESEHLAPKYVILFRRHAEKYDNNNNNNTIQLIEYWIHIA